MKLPLSWLREFVDVDLPPSALAARITDAIAEVEGWETIGGDWDTGLVRVAEVLRVEPHPNADRLRLATVDAGDGEHTVVCGAPNVAPGQKVAFASEGATLFDGHTGKPSVLKRNVIRGVESAGMVLSERELGLSDEHEGILVLPADARVGRPLIDQIGDVVFDISTWANRADLLGVHGLAREVAAMLDLPLHEPDLDHGSSDVDVASLISVEIQAPDLCRRFTASVIRDVTVGPSPGWVQERLRRMGMRPINNVVDVTNYVMLETGQPLHAFDYDLVRGQRIEVRRARPGERLLTLDGVDRELDPEMLMICDAEGPTGIAGIMGGGASEVHAGTTTVLLEVANFVPATIRKTTGKLKLRSEASLRFEKGIGPEMDVVAQHRAMHMLELVAGGKAARGLVDVYPGRADPVPISLPAARIEQVLGIAVPGDAVVRILNALGFAVSEPAPSTYSVTPPFWRPDVVIHDDVVEEIGRIHGYDRVPATMLRGMLPPAELRPVDDLRERVRDALVALGFFEVINYTLVDQRLLDPVVAPGDDLRHRPLAVQNPVASHHRLLRTSLRGSVLHNYAANRAQVDGPLRLFEAGVEYIPVEADLPHERPVVCAVLGGPRESRWARPSSEALDFFDARGVAEAVLAAVRVTATATAATPFGMLPGHAAELLVDGEAVGMVAQVHPASAASLGIEKPVFMVEFWLEPLARLLPARPDYAPPSPYPVARLDLALLVGLEVPAARVLDLVRNHRARDVRIAGDIFDDYRGRGVPEGKRSLAIQLRLQSSERTLTDDDVARERDGLLQRLERELGATLRA